LATTDLYFSFLFSTLPHPAHWSGSQFGNTGYQPVREGTIKYAMINMLQHPPHGFEDAIREHFLLKGPYIQQQIRGWIEDSKRFDDAEKHRTKLIQLYQEFSIELSRLQGNKHQEQTKTKEKEEEEEETKSTGLPTMVKKMTPANTALDCAVLVSNFDGTTQELQELFDKYGTVLQMNTIHQVSDEQKGLSVTEVVYSNTNEVAKCLVLNNTTVQQKTIRVERKKKTYSYEDGKSVGPAPQQAAKEQYEYHQYPF